MSDLGDRIAAEALALLGTKFRLHGRDEQTGLDCIGLVKLALERARGGYAAAAPLGYALRNSEIAQHLSVADRAGLEPATGAVGSGDILLTAPGPAQHHLLIAAGGNQFVHAHAGLRKVVLQRGNNHPILRHWRAQPIIGN